MVKSSSAAKRKASKAVAINKAAGPEEEGDVPPTAASSKSATSAQLLSYLNTFNSDRGAWKYSKKLQVFGLTHAFDAKIIDKPTFRALLPYLASVQGGARDRLVASVEAIIAGDDEEEGGEAPDSLALAKREAVLKRAVLIKRQLEMEAS